MKVFPLSSFGFLLLGLPWNANGMFGHGGTFTRRTQNRMGGAMGNHMHGGMGGAMGNHMHGGMGGAMSHHMHSGMGGPMGGRMASMMAAHQKQHRRATNRMGFRVRHLQEAEVDDMDLHFDEADVVRRPMESTAPLFNGDYFRALLALPDVSVWKLQDARDWMDGNVNAESNEFFIDDAAEFWSPGYMMITKLHPELKATEETIDAIPKRCISSVSHPSSDMPHIDEDDDAESEIPWPSIVMLNTTECVGFDVTLQVVNSASARMFVTKAGEMMSMDMLTTDFLGTSDNMMTELHAMDAIAHPHSIQFRNPGTTLVLNDGVVFRLVPDCDTSGCFGKKVLERAHSFWALDATYSPIDETPESWTFNPVRSVGAWLHVDGADVSDNDSATLLMQPDSFGLVPPPTNPSSPAWRVNLADGSISRTESVPTTRHSEAHESTPWLRELSGILSNAASLTFDFSSVPFSLQVASGMGMQREAILHLSYIGEEPF